MIVDDDCDDDLVDDCDDDDDCVYDDDDDDDDNDGDIFNDVDNDMPIASLSSSVRDILVAPYVNDDGWVVSTTPQ